MDVVPPPLNTSEAHCERTRHGRVHWGFGDDDGGSEGGDADLLLTLGKLTPDHLLYRAARMHNLPVMAQALALGAEKDFVLPGSSSSVIHQSILSGSVMACEFLLLNGARINVLDGDKNTPLHLAAKHGNTGQVCLLLKHRADHHKLNADGGSPHQHHL